MNKEIEKLQMLLEPLFKLQENIKTKANNEKEIYSKKIEELNKIIAKKTAARIMEEARGAKEKVIEQMRQEELQLANELTTVRQMYLSVENFISEALKEEYKELGKSILESKEFKIYGEKLILEIDSINQRLADIKGEQEAIKRKYENEIFELNNKKLNLKNHTGVRETLIFCVEISGAMHKDAGVSVNSFDLIGSYINGDVVFSKEEQTPRPICYHGKYDYLQERHGKPFDKNTERFFEGKQFYNI